MTKLIWATALTVALSACSNIEADLPPTESATTELDAENDERPCFGISPELSATERDDVLVAMALWNDALGYDAARECPDDTAPKRWVTLGVHDCDDDLPECDEDIGGIGTVDAGLVIYKSALEAHGVSLVVVAAHELGHSLGIATHAEHGLMDPHAGRLKTHSWWPATSGCASRSLSSPAHPRKNRADSSGRSFAQCTCQKQQREPAR